MALASYSDLQTAVASWLNRPDLTAAIPDFITLAEKKLDRALRTTEQIKRVRTTVDEEYEALPSDFAELISTFIVESPTTQLTQLSVADFINQGFTTAEQPTHFTIIGQNLRFGPVPTETFTLELVYYATIPALSDSATSNWLLTRAPDVYLYGALIEASPYLREDTRTIVWKTLYDEQVARLNNESQRQQYTKTILTSRLWW